MSETDSKFMCIATAVADASKCLQIQVGSVIVKNGMVLSTGYNGPVKGAKHCHECNRDKLKLPHCKLAVHAEANALIQAGREAFGATMYCTHSPCGYCARLIVNSGVIRFVYYIPYMGDGITIEEILIPAGVEVERVH